MLCYVMLCYVMLSYVFFCFAMLCSAKKIFKLFFLIYSWKFCYLLQFFIHVESISGMFKLTFCSQKTFFYVSSSSHVPQEANLSSEPPIVNLIFIETNVDFRFGTKTENKNTS